MLKLIYIFFVLLASACGGLNYESQKPSRSSIVKNLQKVDVNKCLSLDPKLRGKGIIKVRIVAINSGKVVVANVKNKIYQGTVLANCLENEILRQRFPQFQDSRIVFTFPYNN